MHHYSMTLFSSLSKFKLIFLCVWLVMWFLLFLDENPLIPVQKASVNDWNRNAFWHDTWGASGVHKGIDIFARKGALVQASVSGLVIYCGEQGMGGKVITLLGPKLQVHYYAHLDSVEVGWGEWVSRGHVVGSVGNTGNAKGRPPHLHYSIMSLIPYPHKFTTQAQGWKRMFYINPDEVLR